jgi:glycosyltransferase involved in cell wall biosynthesis
MSLWVALAVGLVMLAWAAKARVSYLSLPNLHRAPRDAAPADCMVVIPARNEEAVIARVVGSLPHDTVIVVDDDSSDATAEIARKAGAGVIPAPALPRNAIGKSNACVAGALLLRSKWILFADADTFFEKGFLEAAVAAAETAGVGFLSIYLRQEGETAWEQILAPFAVALYFCGVSPRREAEAAFNGQCVLVRREVYEFLGGHRAVQTEVIEDVKLAAVAVRHRQKFGLARTSKLGHVRLRKFWRDVPRQARRFMIANPRLGAQILIASLCWAMWLPAFVWLILTREWIAAGTLFLWPAVLLRGWYRGWFAPLVAPLAIYAVLAIVWRGLAAALSGKPVKWKDRAV